MAAESTASTIYSILISIGSTCIIGLFAFSVNRIINQVESNNKARENDLKEHKGEVKEKFNKVEKDLGESFGRIRYLETVTAVTSVKCDANHGGENNGKQPKKD
jgi:hypothetical protein